VIEAPLALCQSDHQPLSEPAQAVRDVLMELVDELLPATSTASKRPGSPI
jgi:LysR family nitrogen assimilation transcriptional regulator